MNQKPNPDEWRVIDFDSRYSTGFVWQRLDWLMKYDPFTSMFTDDSRRALCQLVVNAIGDPDNDGHTLVTNLADVSLVVRNAIENSAMGLMFTHQFMVYFVGLVGTAMFAGSEENGVLA